MERIVDFLRLVAVVAALLALGLLAKRLESGPAPVSHEDGCRMSDPPCTDYLHAR